MPELDFLSLYAYTPEPPKKSPIIKVSCGIGDTDGFPAFDVDSEQYAAKDDSKWGFLITGGAEFHMPLTVFQVTPDGLADKGGICLGDIILEINEEDATQLTLSQAHEKIDASGKKVHFLVKSMDDEELMQGYEPGEERSIVLRVPKPLPPPKASSIEERLQELQRKLSEIAEIPKILSSTLATVSQTFDKLTMNMATPSTVSSNCHHFLAGNECIHNLCEIEQKRKLSYDEDVYDYELSDDDDNDNDDDDDNDNKDEVEKKQFNVKEAYLQLKRYAARQRKSKEVTPESDYASENNYQQNESGKEECDNFEDTSAASDSTTSVAEYNDNDDNDDSNDDEERCCDMYEEFELSALQPTLGHDRDESDVEEYDEKESVDNGDDFLTTTLTWNLRNKPKLQINDESEDIVNSHKSVDDDKSDDIEDEKKFNDVQEKSFNNCEDIINQKPLKNESPDRQQKIDKLERFWPWADREKIIYKQSTCHLVPRKPLGLIEQRIQLLAKRNLLEHLNKSKSPH